MPASKSTGTSQNKSAQPKIHPSRPVRITATTASTHQSAAGGSACPRVRHFATSCGEVKIKTASCGFDPNGI